MVLNEEKMTLRPRKPSVDPSPSQASTSTTTTDPGTTPPTPLENSTPPASLKPLMEIDPGLRPLYSNQHDDDSEQNGSWNTVVLKGKRKSCNTAAALNTSTSSESSTSTMPPVVKKVFISGLPTNLRSTKSLYQVLRQHVPELLITYLSVNHHGQASISSPQEQLMKQLKSFSNQLALNLTLSEARPKQQLPAPRRIPTFSLVIRGVETDITMPEVEYFLNKGSLPFRNVWRIRSRATGLDTSLVRVITNSQHTLDLLLSRGLYMFHHVYTVEPSNPPPAQPIQCGKCFKYDLHSTSNCPEKTPTCGICSEPHTTSSCKSSSPAKCTNCQGDHPAYTYKCPSRPAAPASQETAAPLRPAVPVEGNQKSFRNLMSFMATAMLNLLPDQKDRIQSFLFPLMKHHFGYDISASYAGNSIHITIA